ncbi:MAG TPA: glycosyltransferase family 1 protein [Gammaproteobacteria bacterium]|nr:glycosyltransferase family 1 protein [Gammaproteobacteria bacterium]
MEDSQRKRVLLVVRYPVGGIRTYIRYIYQQDIFDEYDFSVIAPDPGLESFFREIFSGRNFEYDVCEDNWDLLKKVWRYTRNNKVALIHSHGFTAGSLSAVIARCFHIKHLMTAHDVFQKKQFSGFKGKVKKWLLSRVFVSIDMIHTVSFDATNDLLAFFPAIKKERIRCIPHGIDAEQFYHSTASDLKLSYDKTRTCLIGFFGRFMAQKGFNYLIDAIEIIVRDKLTDREPLVLTFDWGGFVREEYEYIESRGLKKYFHMMQHTDDMPGVIKAMDLVAMPSLWESSGLLGMESLVSGVPIIGASCIGLREVLSDSPAVLVPPRDSQALARALADEINDPQKKTFREFSDVARQRFSLLRPSSELKKIYTEIISG